MLCLYQQKLTVPCQVPLIISELGGYGERDDKSARISAFKQKLHPRPIAGDVYTLATSIEEEVNGIIDPVSGSLLVPPAYSVQINARRHQANSRPPGAPHLRSDGRRRHRQNY